MTSRMKSHGRGRPSMVAWLGAHPIGRIHGLQGWALPDGGRHQQAGGAHLQGRILTPEFRKIGSHGTAEEETWVKEKAENGKRKTGHTTTAVRQWPPPAAAR